MKMEERTEFLIDWGDGQQLTVHEGLAVATGVLQAGPLPLQIAVRTTTYMALGQHVPARWLALFDKSLEPTAVQAELSYAWREALGICTQAMSLAPCEQGGHLHANVTVSYSVFIEAETSTEALTSALYEAWRTTGERMEELQLGWIAPFLEQALVIEELHGGQ